MKGGQHVNWGYHFHSLQSISLSSLSCGSHPSLSPTHPWLVESRSSLRHLQPVAIHHCQVCFPHPSAHCVCVRVCVRGDLSAPDTHSPVGAVIGEGAYGDARSPHHPPLLSHSKYHSNGRLRNSIFCPRGDLNASRARGVPVGSQKRLWLATSFSALWSS